MKINELLEYVISNRQKQNALDNKATIIVTMPPEMFLKLTTSEDYHDTDMRHIQNKALSKDEYQKMMDVENITVHPFLDVDEKSGKIDRHEGRSRAYAAMLHGDKDYEVAIHITPPSRQLSLKDIPKIWYGQFNRKYTVNFEQLVKSNVIKVLNDNVQKQYQKN